MFDRFQHQSTLRPSSWLHFDAQRVETGTLVRVVKGVKDLLKSLERATGMEDATKKGQAQEFFHKKLQRRPG